MFYSGYYFGGMHFIWWGIWLVMLFWIFALPYNIPGQRMKKDSPLDILQKRYATGEITSEEYMKRREIIESDMARLK